MLKVIKGDLLKMANDGEFDVIAHGANCFLKFGAGIALQIKKTFPEAYEADKKTRCGDVAKLGTSSLAKVKNNLDETLRVINCYTQYDYKSKAGESPIDYKALDTCLREVKNWLDGQPFSLGIPMIGYGLAGGDLIPILDIFTDQLNDLNATIVIYDKDPKADELVNAITVFIELKKYNFDNKL